LINNGIRVKWRLGSRMLAGGGVLPEACAGLMTPAVRV